MDIYAYFSLKKRKEKRRVQLYVENFNLHGVTVWILKNKIESNDIKRV